MTSSQQSAVAFFGIILAIFGMFLALWFYSRGGGRRTGVVVSIDSASKESTEQFVRLASLSSCCVVMALSIKNVGPRDIQVMDAMDRHFQAARPHLDVPSGYHVKKILRLTTQEYDSSDYNIPIAYFPGHQKLTFDKCQRISLHIRRLRAKTESVILIAFAPLHSNEVLPPCDSSQFKFYRGWIQDVNVFGKIRAVQKCNGRH